MPAASSFLRQMSVREAWKSTSRRWGGGNSNNPCGGNSGGATPHSEGSFKKQMEGFSNMYGGGGYGYGENATVRKRVMVVVDDTSHSKHAMMWALTHIANKGDLLTLLHIMPSTSHGDSSAGSPYLANSLGSLCKACKPEVCYFFFFCLRSCVSFFSFCLLFTKMSLLDIFFSMIDPISC